MGKLSLKNLIVQFSDGLDAVEGDFLGVLPYHGKRVALLCIYIGEKLGYDDMHLFDIAGCAMLHDNALTEYLLSERPGSAQEFNTKSHCITGEENCKYFPFPGDTKGYVMYHHERADGSGAFGRKTGEYPREADMIAMADQLDVQCELWRAEGADFDGIRQYLIAYRGKWYDREIADIALELLVPGNMAEFSNERINAAIRQKFPDYRQMLTKEETVRIAGMVARIIDYKSSFTKEHTIQIANKAWYMSGIYNYDIELRARIYLAAALHDLGKLFIPTDILEKQGKLTEEEFTIIKSHANYTWKCLHGVEGFEDIAEWAGNHHEKLDGTGYPFGKKDTELDYISRLIACLDIYQAVREARPYHPERSHEDTMKILEEMANGGGIDKGIVRDLNLHLKGLPGGRADYPHVPFS